jgi:DNA-nicking Smr family endonuclease
MSAFDQLKSIHETLNTQRLQSEAKARREALAAAKRAAEADIFRTEMRDALPLPPANRAPLKKPLPEPHPHQRELDEARVLQDALSDEFGVEQLLETDQDLSWRRSGIGPEVLPKLRRGFWTIQSQLDLHGARTEEARELLAAYLREACSRGLRCVRIVHGKGLGSKDRQPVLKAKVRSWLMQKEQVIAFVTARPAEGGGGALIVLLRPQSMG